MDSAELSRLHDDVDALVDGEDLDAVISVLTTVLAECLAQVTDYNPNREAFMRVMQHVSEIYLLLCSPIDSVTIN